MLYSGICEEGKKEKGGQEILPAFGAPGECRRASLVLLFAGS
jgi:hypothetical protein